LRSLRAGVLNCGARPRKSLADCDSARSVAGASQSTRQSMEAFSVQFDEHGSGLSVGKTRSFPMSAYDPWLTSSIWRKRFEFRTSAKFTCVDSYNLRSGAINLRALTATQWRLNLKRAFLKFVSDESGATAIEYGLIAAGIALAIIAIVNSMGTNLMNKFTDINTSLK